MTVAVELLPRGSHLEQRRGVGVDPAVHLGLEAALVLGVDVAPAFGAVLSVLVGP